MEGAAATLCAIVVVAAGLLAVEVLFVVVVAAPVFSLGAMGRNKILERLTFFVPFESETLMRAPRHANSNHN